MGRSQHILPAIANRLRISRGFDNVWYSDVHYAHLIQKDWVLSKNAWSLVNRASRSRPRQQLTLDQQLQHLQALRAARAKGEKVDVKAIAAAAVEKSNAGKALGMAGCDYPNLRVSRVFTQHLPYKSIVSTFAYSVPEAGPQSKYGLFPKTSGQEEGSRQQGGRGGRGGEAAGRSGQQQQGAGSRGR